MGGWGHNGVAQFRQAHILLSRARQILDEELPGVVDRLVGGGCVRLNPVRLLPPSIADRAPRPGDDAFGFVTGRRPVVESVVAAAAAEADGVDIRRGVGIAGLVTGSSVVAGVPHVIGVRPPTATSSEPT